MIPPGAWYFLATLNEAERANAIGTELVDLGKRADVYLGQIKTWIGALVICTLACIASVNLQHVALAQATICVVLVGHFVRGRQEDAFQKDWRRAEFLRGYMRAKAGESPD